MEGSIGLCFIFHSELGYFIVVVAGGLIVDDGGVELALIRVRERFSLFA